MNKNNIYKKFIKNNNKIYKIQNSQIYKIHDHKLK